MAQAKGPAVQSFGLGCQGPGKMETKKRETISLMMEVDFWDRIVYNVKLDLE